MAGPLLYDRVKESTTTTGAGTLTLAGALTGFQAFSVVGNANTCPYVIYEVDANGNPSGAWEVGTGTYTLSGTTLSRAVILASSNSGSAVDFGAGTKHVALTLPAALKGVDANPSASVGLSAVNGSASTFIRSDGAPALDVTIAPTWTGVHTFTPAARSSGSAAYLTVNAPADTALTASTEAIGINFAGATRQHATGAITTQREYVFGAPTYSFVGASTVTTAVTLETASPIAGTNATLTKSIGARFTASASAHVALVTQAGAATPTGDVQQWTKSDGTVFAHAGYDSSFAGYFIGWKDGSNLLELGPNAANRNYIRSNTSIGFSANNNSTHAVLTSSTLSLYVAMSINDYVTFTYASSGVTVTFADTSGQIRYKGFAARIVAITNYQTSAGGSLGNVSGGCVGDVFADVSTTHTDGTFDTLRTDTLVANALIVNGDKIFAKYCLKVTNHTTANIDIKATFAGITILDTGVINVAAAATVDVYVMVIRKDSTHCRAFVLCEFFGSTALIQSSVGQYTDDAALTGLTLTGTNNLVLSAAPNGTGAASGDATLVMGTVHVDGFGS